MNHTNTQSHFLLPDFKWRWSDTLSQCLLLALQKGWSGPGRSKPHLPKMKCV